MWGMIITFLPFIFFGVPLLFIFGFFISGAFNLMFSEDPERGKDTIVKSLTYFMILLAVFLVFITVSYLVKAYHVFEPPPKVSEFPVSPMGVFPPNPPFIYVGDYSFSGPWPLAQKDTADITEVYAIFCKKEQGYDIIDLGIASERRRISDSQAYQCWLENCQKNAANLYIGFYWTPAKSTYSYQHYFTEIKAKTDFICKK